MYAKLLLIVKTKVGLKQNFRIRMLEGHHVHPGAAYSGVREERLQKQMFLFSFGAIVYFQGLRFGLF